MSLSSRYVANSTRRMLLGMPRLWTQTIEDHRRAVGEAIVETTAALVAQHGLRAVTMSRIAEETGIGRATLYKYFPDVESILLAWHERQIRAHLEQLTDLEPDGDPAARLTAVLEAYALIQHERHEPELAALLHRDPNVAQAQQHLRDFLRDLIAEGAAAGRFRDDVPAEELAGYCVHALNGARGLPDRPAARRLVAVTLAGLGAAR
jgi:AcrR family transcriptional regulator